MIFGKKAGLVALPSQYENVTVIILLHTTRLLTRKLLNLRGL